MTRAEASLKMMYHELQQEGKGFLLIFFGNFSCGHTTSPTGRLGILYHSKISRGLSRHSGCPISIKKKHQLVAYFKKCTFGQPQLDYLGHIISAKGVAADPQKIEAML